MIEQSVRELIDRLLELRDEIDIAIDNNGQFSDTAVDAFNEAERVFKELQARVTEGNVAEN